MLRRLFGAKSETQGVESPLRLRVERSAVEDRRGRRPVLDRFYDLQERMDRAQRDRLGDVVLELCDAAVAMLPAFVDAWRDEELEGRRLLGDSTALADDWFVISSIRCVELTCRWAAIRGDVDRLSALRDTLVQRIELKPWTRHVDEAFNDMRACDRLVDAISNEPGSKQAGFARTVGVDSRRAATLFGWLEADGRVVRERDGNTYRLFLPNATAPEPPLSMAVNTRSERLLHIPSPPSADQLATLRGVCFAAIDFETATSTRSSACALGVLIVDDAKPVRSERFMIRPPRNEYEPFNTMLHGIGPTDTAYAPELPEVWEYARTMIGDLPIVAHNAAFDVGVLRDGLLEADVPWPTLQVYCTLVLARRAWPGLLTYGLGPLVHFCGGELEHHHDPVDDAAACAALALAVCATTETGSLEDAARSLGVHGGRLDAATYEACRANYLRSGDLARIRLDANPDADPTHPLYDRTVVFTGTLNSMTRAQARLTAASVGAHATTSVSRKTDYLVSGHAEYHKFTDGEHSNKTLKAQELLAQGHPIEVISEGDFLRLLLSGDWSI